MDYIKNNILNKDNKQFYNNLFNQLYLAIYNNNIDLLIQLINELLENKNNKYEYLNYLLNPSIYKYIKIPNKIKLPTTSFQIHRIIKTKANEEGNIGILFNPFFIYDDDLIGDNNKNYINDTEFMHTKEDMIFYNNKGEKHTYKEVINQPDKNWEGYYAIRELSSLYINTFSIPYTDELYNNIGDIYFNPGSWNPININQKTKLFTSYRLVSAEIIVKYINSDSNASGSFYGGILNDEKKYLGGYIYYLENYDVPGEPAPTPGTVEDIEIQKLYNESMSANTTSNLTLSNLYNLYYHKQTKCIEGIKLIYFPIDNSYEEFIPLLNYSNLEYLTEYPAYYFLIAKKNYKYGFNFFIIGNKLPANCDIQIEISCNFEAFYKTKYLNHIPINQTNIQLSNDEKNKIINIINNNNIFKANEDTFLNINKNE